MVILRVTSFLEGHKSDTRETYRITRVRERKKHEREKETEIVRKTPNHSWVTSCGIRNRLTFPSRI
jgi:hypothetical protein